MEFDFKEFENRKVLDNSVSDKWNTELYWFKTDTEERFNMNLSQNPNSIHLNEFKKYPIVYRLNNFGFRSSDNYDVDSVGNVFLGDGNTYGIGHYLSDTWSKRISEFMGDRFFNLSQPNSGIMTHHRYLNYFKNHFKFKNVFHYLPNESWNIFELVNDNEYKNINVNEISEMKTNINHLEI
jgi:hypothetical protein